MCRHRPGAVRQGHRVTSLALASVAADDRSSRPCSPSRSSTSRWSWSNTPAPAHSPRRRQHVAGEPQPSSRAGSSRQGWRCGPCRRARRSSCGRGRCGAGRRRAGAVGREQGFHDAPHSSSGTRSSARSSWRRILPGLPQRERNDVMAGGDRMRTKRRYIDATHLDGRRLSRSSQWTTSRALRLLRDQPTS